MRLSRLALAATGLLASLLLTGCETKAGSGALIGGALGAGTGAIIGNQSGHSGGGAAIGGAVGALSGAIIGDQMDQQDRKNQTPPPPPPNRAERGHYENRLVRTPSGETYEERVWVPDR